MNSVTKPLIVGERLTGGCELGEIYHVAAMLCQNASIPVVMSSSGDSLSLAAHEFLQEIKGASIEVVNPKDCHIPNSENKLLPKYNQSWKTANWLRKRLADFTERYSFVLKCYGVSKCEDIKLLERFRHFASKRLKKVKNHYKVLIWIRNVEHEPERNSTVASIDQLRELVLEMGFFPVLVGKKLKDLRVNETDFLNFYDCNEFASISGNPLKKQLQLLRVLNTEYNTFASVGMKSGGMDGGAFFSGIPTVFFEEAQEVGYPSRMEKIAKIHPNFRKIDLQMEGDNNGRFVGFLKEELQCLARDLKSLYPREH